MGIYYLSIGLPHTKNLFKNLHTKTNPILEINFSTIVYLSDVFGLIRNRCLWFLYKKSYSKVDGKYFCDSKIPRGIRKYVVDCTVDKGD